MLSSNHTPLLSIEGREGFLTLLSYCLEEGIDHLDSLLVAVNASEDKLPEETDSYLDKNATFTLTDAETKVTRYFHGVVWEAGWSTDDDGTARLELLIRPELARLEHRLSSRIYMDLTLEKIVEEVLGRTKVTVDKKWKINTATEIIPYCIQYEETDLAFITRLLARDGVSFLYRDGEKPQLIFTDDVPKLEESAAKELVFRPLMGAETGASTVYHVEQEHLSVPDKVKISGFDPHRPSLKIEGEKQATSDKECQSEIYFSLTNRPSNERAARVADVTLNSYQCRREMIQAETLDHTLALGQHVSIVGHPYGPLNAEYLVLKIRHAAEREVEFSFQSPEAKRSIRFWAVPVGNGYMPQRTISEVTVLGLQTAITTGESGDDINTNAHGESTVHFHWDRVRPKDQTSSRFMRTAQLPTGGSMLLPRVGWEVTVTHLEGDGDEPMVVSRLYNGATMPPYALPENALKSSIQTGTTPSDGSSNEIRMSDVKGEEQMMFNASKDMAIDVGHNTTQSVGNDLKVTVGANHSLTVIDSYKSTVGANHELTVSGNRSQNITSLAVDDVTGNHSTKIGGNLTQMIGGDHRRTLKATSELSIGGNCMSATIGSYTLDTKAGFDHKVDAACLEIVKGSRSVIVGAAKTETTNGAKVILTQSTRSVEVGILNTTIGGAMMIKADGNRTLSSKTALCETAAGMEKAEAANVTIEGQMAVTLTMGGAVISMTPASISVTGANITVDGNLIQVAPMNLNN